MRFRSRYTSMMDGAGLDQFRPALAQAGEMAVGALASVSRMRRLLRDQAAGERDVARGEDVERQPQVLEHPRVEGPQLGEALGREG